MTRRRTILLCAAPLLWGALLVASGAAAQVNAGPTVPKPSKTQDVEEVEELVPDSEYLPAEGETDDEAAPGGIRHLQDDELSLSSAEQRGRHDYSVSLALGWAKPWTVFSLDVASIVRPDLEIGMWAGGGRFSNSGIQDDKSFDLRLNSRSAGLSARWHMERLEGLSFEAVLGYAAWEGRVTPHGSEAELGESPAVDKLSASFRAHGPVVGVSAAFTWLWDRGWYLEWTPIGARKSRMAQKDLSRGGGPLVERALSQTIESASFYGLTNLEVGYKF